MALIHRHDWYVAYVIVWLHDGLQEINYKRCRKCPAILH